MNATQRKAATGGLGSPSKMPGKSYGIPAAACKLGAILAKKEGTICASCYATRGNYRYSSVQTAQRRRLESMADLARWSAAMVETIRAEVDPTDPYFRWHDSGDLQSVAHLGAIVRIARALPTIRFWLPTRERGMIRDWLELGLAIPRNLRIRVSANVVGRDTSILASWRRRGITTSSVDGDGYACPAPEQGNSCGDCRACWDPTARVSYHLHKSYLGKCWPLGLLSGSSGIFSVFEG